MYLHEVASNAFVLLQAGWPVGKARQLIGRLEPTHVIVYRTDPRDYYHLYTKSEALGRLAGAPDQISLYYAFNLHEYTATPTLDAYANAETAPDRSVVIEDGLVIGFFDVTVPPPASESFKRGMDARDHEPAEPVPRSLVADFPEQVRLAETVSLLVSLSVESAQGTVLPIALPVGARVDVVVQPKRGFVLEGTGEGSLVISDEEETLPLQFRLKAAELGLGKIRVLSFHQGQPLGAITLAPAVVPAVEAAAEQRHSHEQPVALVSVQQPDLSLLILEHEDRPAISFTQSRSFSIFCIQVGHTPSKASVNA